ncbi:AraC family transcriptional regulator [Nostoc sp.]|uniref:AraC family transcriptional regulator n=1 Tax=Nostoc sp. TaxID=1180 RepID=UPI002FF56F91
MTSPTYLSVDFLQECLKTNSSSLNLCEGAFNLSYKKLRNIVFTVHRILSFAIAQIAYQVGYESTSHFSYLFKRQFGMTPREYRQQKGL